MTTITIYKSNTGSFQGFTCSGHAGFAYSGKDIVCAAVSILVINTINSLEELVHEEMTLNTDEATGYIDCRFTHEIRSQAQLLMDSMILGLESIAEQYGSKYLRLIFKEV